MDYRERKYYLVRFNDLNLNWWNRGHDDYGIRYNSYINMVNRKIPSIKVHAPYNHFKTNTDKHGYDGSMKNIGYIQLMVSCRKENIKEFEDLLLKIKEKDSYVVVKEITKEMCGQ